MGAIGKATRFLCERWWDCEGFPIDKWVLLDSLRPFVKMLMPLYTEPVTILFRYVDDKQLSGAPYRF